MKLEPVFLTPESGHKLDLYLDMLWRWGKAFNLSGAKNRLELDLLARDSLCLARFMEALFPGTGPTTWDLGAGAGLPGIPLRLAWGAGDYTLVEPREKRAIFLANVLAKLKLPRTSVVQERAERFFKARPAPDCILSRAFMPWPELLAFCRPIMASGALLIIMANEPPGNLPSGWRLKETGEYAAGPANRWLWAISTKE